MFNHLGRSLMVGASILLCMAAMRSASAQSYTITNLGLPPNSALDQAYGINDSGQVVGTGALAFIWTNGSFTDIPTLGGTFNQGLAINSSGEAVGLSQTKTEDVYHAFLYSGGKVTDLGTLGAPFSEAVGINDSGVVVGNSEYTTKVADVLAFEYSNGKMTSLGTLGGLSSGAEGINDAGVIIGYSYVSPTSSALDAFIYQNGKMTALPSLGDVQYPNSVAMAINANDQIAGYSYDASGTQRAAFWQNGTVTNLDTLDSGGSDAGAINSSGVVVGTVNDSFDPIDDPVNDAFVYQNGVMTDLNSLVPANSGWVLEYANGINDSGVITGWGTFNGNERAFTLTPVK